MSEMKKEGYRGVDRSPHKKKGQPHAKLAGTGPELCGREEVR